MTNEEWAERQVDYLSEIARLHVQIVAQQEFIADHSPGGLPPMTERQPVIIRPWPALMSAQTAAEYVDAPSADAFRKAVERGLYPPGIKRHGERLKWLKADLDRYIAANDEDEGDDIA
jgi:hypothetical protein